MNDMSSVIVPKSDQINADSLIPGPMTVTIKDVKIAPGTEQPVSMILEETPLFYRPCKSMSRVLVGAWGPDAKKYIGRRLTLYRDPTVTWGGVQVGGIRISHMSDITEKKTMALTATRAQRKPFTVQPLTAAPAKGDAAAKWAGGYIAKLATFTALDALEGFEAEKAAKLAELQTARPDLHAQVTAALTARKAELAPDAGSFDDDLTPAQPTDSDPLAATLTRITNAASIREVDAIDKETDADRTFLTEAQIDSLDEALATKREALRTGELEQAE